MKAWAIIWSTFILIAIIGMTTGARWMWGIVFIGGVMLCGALAEIAEEKEQKKNKSHGRR